MLKISGHDIYRAGEKVGHLSDKYVMSHDGKKLGYTSGDAVYDVEGKKLAWLEGNHVYLSGSSTRVDIDDVNTSIEGGMLPNVTKAAIRIFLGE